MALTLKTWLGDDCRRIVVPVEPRPTSTSSGESAEPPAHDALAALLTRIRATYLLAPTTPLVLRYRDSDGDVVTVASNTDLQHLVESAAAEPAAARISVSIVGGPADPDPARFAFDQPKSVDRSLFSPDFTNDEVVEVLRDISYYISTRGPQDYNRTVPSKTRPVVPVGCAHSPEPLRSSKSATTVNDSASADSAYDRERGAPLAASSSTNVYAWTANDVAAWLAGIGLEGVRATFQEHDILGDVLLELDNETLKDMGIASAGHRLRLVRAIDGLRHRTAAAIELREPAARLGEEQRECA